MNLSRPSVDTTPGKGLSLHRLLPAFLISLSTCERLRTNVYVVTNKPQAAAESILHHLKLSDFILRVAGDDLSGTQTKPERAAKLAQEERLCGGLFIGDGLDDLRAAERINAHFLLAGWGYGTSTVLAEHPTVPTLSSPEELKRLLEQ
jgi:phosphoglycolate phosphatase-like HAD superfamily hydrolase